MNKQYESNWLEDQIKQLTAERDRLREAIIFTIRDGHAHKACVEQMIAALKGKP